MGQYEVLEQLNKQERNTWCSAHTIKEALDSEGIIISMQSIRKCLKNLCMWGIVEREVNGIGTYYRVKKKYIQKLEKE
jgi:CTP-dependent riboflavin kinase